jgi:hypothetical protein
MTLIIVQSSYASICGTHRGKNPAARDADFDENAASNLWAVEILLEMGKLYEHQERSRRLENIRI